MTTSSKETAPPTQGAPASTTAPAPSSGASVQLRGSLRGLGFAAQEARLAPVQASGSPSGDVHKAAAEGISGGGGTLPHLDAIQKSFGGHDVSGVQAHTGSEAAAASQAMGAEAYATGNHIAFGKTPDLHTAAHEAAHVVQQQAGVQLSDGVGKAGDPYEQHADAVADKVVKGESAEAALGTMTGGGGAGVQQRAIQRTRDPLWETRLPGLGVPGPTVSDLEANFPKDELETYITEVGEGRFVELTKDKGLKTAALKANGGAAFYKTFVGCGAESVRHVVEGEGIVGAQVKGCHDDLKFTTLLAEVKDFKMPKMGNDGKQELLPASPKELEANASALEKYNKQKAMRDEQIKTKGSSKIPEPKMPGAPKQEGATEIKSLTRGVVNDTRALSTAGVQVRDYSVRVENGAEIGKMRPAGQQMKTTVTGLEAAPGPWQALCNEALWNLIRTKSTLPQEWHALTDDGTKLTGFYNGGPEVATFFFEE